MSHFYANIQGNRGEATRQGTKESGMFGHIRSWNTGIRVNVAHYDLTPEEKRAKNTPEGAEAKDVFLVHTTGGSGGDASSLLLFSVVAYLDKDGGLIEQKMVAQQESIKNWVIMEALS